MKGTIRVGNLFGIPFNVHPFWFFVMSLFTLEMTGQFSGLGRALPSPFPSLLGLSMTMLLLASLLIHELGHCFVAIRQGIKVVSIGLLLFGCVANLEKESKTPDEAFWVAITGPMVSLVLFGIITAIVLNIKVSGPLAVILNQLASINLMLALFNLIPGLPLDGGNILKALVWKLTGNYHKGVVFASRAGQIFGLVAIVSGLFGNIWHLLIGWFLLQEASQTAQEAMCSEQTTKTDI